MPAVEPRIVVIVQARMGSTRLPGKSLADIGGLPLIERMLRQVAASRTVDEVVLATTIDPSDDPLVAVARAGGWRVIRGDVDDVLGRFLQAAEGTDADVVVRLTGDCPLHSADTIDQVVTAFLANGVECAWNTDPYTRPDGQDVVVFTRDLLERAAKETVPGPDREHVTPWMLRANGIRRLHVRHSPAGGASMRWTVDEPSDLEFVRAVWRRLDAQGAGRFSFEVIMNAVLETGARQGEGISNAGYYRSLFDSAIGCKAPALALAKNEEWLKRSERVIPGGAQTYSKSWRQNIRGVSPIFLLRGQGARVWDVDGNEYVDLIQGLLPNILGYAHADVDRAVYEQAQRGHSFSLPHPLEVELAERLVRIIPCAEMVRFGKNGSDATAGAVRVARAFTGRDRVAVCGYHGWQDWYIGATSRYVGVPPAVRQLTHPFPYNDLDALDRLLSSHRDEFAAVIMEPVNFFWPAEGYLAGVKELAQRHGALLIFDEICSGFHLGLGGAQKLFGVVPDLAAFGKAMGNGYPISCVVGRRDVMRTFEDAFVSFTFAGDVAAMAAADVVLDVLEHTDAFARMEAAGRAFADGARVMAARAALGDRFKISGNHNWFLLNFTDKDGNEDPLLKAVWTQEVTRRGVLLIYTNNICAALTSGDIHCVLTAYAEAFKFVGRAISDGTDLNGLLDGQVPTPAFRVRG